jgi:hypothetical protein
VSGETSAAGAPPRVLSTIRKPGSPPTAIGLLATASTVARGGASRGRRSRKRATAAASPSTSSTTPRSSLATKPSSPSASASRNT